MPDYENSFNTLEQDKYGTLLQNFEEEAEVIDRPDDIIGILNESGHSDEAEKYNSLVGRQGEDKNNFLRFLSKIDETNWEEGLRQAASADVGGESILPDLPPVVFNKAVDVYAEHLLSKYPNKTDVLNILEDFSEPLQSEEVISVIDNTLDQLAQDGEFVNQLKDNKEGFSEEKSARYVLQREKLWRRIPDASKKEALGHVIAWIGRVSAE